MRNAEIQPSHLRRPRLLATVRTGSTIHTLEDRFAGVRDCGQGHFTRAGAPKAPANATEPGILRGMSTEALQCPDQGQTQPFPAGFGNASAMIASTPGI